MKNKIKKNNITITHPNLMKEWDYTKNQGIDPTTLTHGSNIKVWWKCLKCGHEWEAKICERVRGNGCPANGCRKYTHRFVGKNITITHPNLMKEWDYTKNQGIDPTTLTYGSQNSVWWKCSKCGHEWRARIANRAGGSGCPANGCRKYTHRFVEKNITITHPDLMKEWDYVKNQGIDPTTLTYGSNIDVWWKCSKCGHEWQAPIIKRCTRGRSCPICKVKERKNEK